MDIEQKTCDKDAGVLLCVLSCGAKEVSAKFLRHLVEETDSDLYDLLWVDNGSKDGTVKMLRKHWDETNNTTLIFNDDNRGVIGGRNQGFDFFLNKTSSQYLIFLDNDQFVRQGWLEHHLAVLHRGYDLVGAEAWQLSPRFIPVRKNMKRTDWYSYVGCGGMLIRRHVVEEIGGFDERFNPSYFEDPDFCFRAFDEKFKIGWNFKARIFHMAHQTLGRVGDKAKRFVTSLGKFRDKWKKRKPPMILMPHLPEFD